MESCLLILSNKQTISKFAGVSEQESTCSFSQVKRQKQERQVSLMRRNIFSSLSFQHDNLEYFFSFSVKKSEKTAPLDVFATWTKKKGVKVKV